MKPALWFLLGAGAVALLAQDAVEDWAQRFASWTATRNVDAPVRNAIHLRQTAALNAARAAQVQLYSVPRNRRLALEQVAAYCLFGNFGAYLNQIHVSSLTRGIVARYPIARTFYGEHREFLAGPLHQYADAETPVVVDLVFSEVTNANCEVTATGHLAELNP